MAQNGLQASPFLIFDLSRKCIASQQECRGKGGFKKEEMESEGTLQKEMIEILWHLTSPGACDDNLPYMW